MDLIQKQLESVSLFRGANCGADDLIVNFESTFGSSLAIWVLENSRFSEAENIIRSWRDTLYQKAKKSNFLLTYWENIQPQKYTVPYPPDWDDISNAMVALRPLMKDLAPNLIEMLTASEVQMGGPYLTWLKADIKNNNDLDFYVNLAIHIMLRRYDIELGPLKKWLNEKLEKAEGFPESTFYASNYVRAFLIYRFGLETNEEAPLLRIRAWVRAQKPISSKQYSDYLIYQWLLSQTGGAVDVKFLEAVLEAKSYPKSAFAFTVGSNLGTSQTRFDGYPVLLKAFAATALQPKLTVLHRAQLNAITTGQPSQRAKNNANEQYFESIWQAFISEGQFKLKSVLTILEKIKTNTFTKEVVLLPTYLSNLKFSEKDRIEISIANLFGWCYFILQDKLIDEVPDKESRAEWSTTNIVQCYMLARYVLKLREISSGFDVTKFALENSDVNLKEIAEGVSEDSIVKRSTPYFLGVVAMMQRNNFPKRQIDEMIKALSAYLLAKQINDDLHDFVEDLKQNKNSLVISWVKKNLGSEVQDATGRTTSNKTAEIFITKGMPHYIERIEQNIKIAEKSLKNLPPIETLKIGLQQYHKIRAQYNSLRRNDS